MASHAWMLVATAMILAGCAGEPVSPAATEDAPPPTGEAFLERIRGADGSYVDVYEVSGVVTGAGWLTHQPDDAPVSLLVPVQPNATSLRVSVAWDGAPADFDAVLWAPKMCEEASLDARRTQGLDCMLVHASTKESGDGWFHAPGTETGESVLEIDGADIAAWNLCKAPPCRWQALAFYNLAAQTPFTLRAEVAY